MRRAKRAVRALDRFQQCHGAFGFPVAVVKKFGDDRASAFATRIAYQGLFAMFPLLLVFTTVLGLVLEGHPGLRRDILDSVLADFPILGTELRDAAKPLSGSGLALGLGIVGTFYGALGLGHAVEAAMNTVWNVPRAQWPNFFFRRIRSVAMVTAIALGTLASTTAGALVSRVPWGGAVLAFMVGFAIDFTVFAAVFEVLTAIRLGWRDVWLGAVVASGFWNLLKLLGAFYVSRVLRNADDVYGFFAVVIALLSWMYLAAQLTILAAECNVVARQHLWPRSITQPPFIGADREVYRRLAQTTVRRPEYHVETNFDKGAGEEDS